MKSILDCCCGLDVHKDKIEACILKTAEQTAIRSTFGSKSSELDRLCEWLNENECYHVAMESTGVYWQPIYDRIEEKCLGIISLMVVNAHHMHNVPGRKTDVKDAEWIAELLQHGLLTNSFIPRKEIRTMREISRARRKYVQERSTHLNRLEKYLQSHGFKLSSVVSNILGASGEKILRKLAVQGSLSLSEVASCCNQHLRKSPEEIHEAISGKLEQLDCLFLQSELDWLDNLNVHINRLSMLLKEITKDFKEKVHILDTIPGINEDSAIEVLAEISDSPKDSFATAANLSNWAGLAPRNDESAGDIKSRKILHGNPYIKSILVQCAWAAVKARNSRFSIWFWKHSGRLGKKKAIIAVARKLLVTIYTMLETGEIYNPLAA